MYLILTILILLCTKVLSRSAHLSYQEVELQKQNTKKGLVHVRIFTQGLSQPHPGTIDSAFVPVLSSELGFVLVGNC